MEQEVKYKSDLGITESPCIMCVCSTMGGAQYRGGVQYRGGYHEYRGGIS